MRGLFVMAAQEVVAKIVFKIAPHAVDVVGIVLGIVVFEQEGRSLHPIVVAFPAFYATRPGELQIVPKEHEPHRTR